MRIALPTEVVSQLAPLQRAETEAWWSALDDDARAEFVALWDTRSEDTAYYARTEDGRTEWHPLPITLRAQFVDPEDAREHAMWVGHLREYVNAHDQIRFFLVDRRFHICRGHPAARVALETGVLHASFRCPLAQAACPLAQALAMKPGCSIVLTPCLASRDA